MLEIAGLHKEFLSHDKSLVKAVDGVTFSVPEGKIFTLLGPSGCGKTTTLRCIAGLEDAQAGTIQIGGEVVFDPQQRIRVPSHRRDIGMVFQSYAIWPHLSVFKNASFPLEVERGRASHSEIRRRVLAVLEKMQLSELAGRNATKLSGGQQQRLALARALVREPKLLLLDEPLSNLDAKLREEMRFELKRLQKDFGITSLYVTHDQFEALALSDQIAVMSAGTIQQIGSPREIYEKPVNRFVASFIGSTNFLEAEIIRRDAAAGWLYVRTPLGQIRASGDITAGENRPAILAIRPEHIRLTKERPETGTNVFEGRVGQAAYLGEKIDTEVMVGDRLIRAHAHPDLDLAPGDSVHARLPTRRCIVLH